jgi:hypothetical protein
VNAGKPFEGRTVIALLRRELAVYANDVDNEVELVDAAATGCRAVDHKPNDEAG